MYFKYKIKCCHSINYHSQIYFNQTDKVHNNNMSICTTNNLNCNCFSMLLIYNSHFYKNLLKNMNILLHNKDMF